MHRAKTKRCCNNLQILWAIFCKNLNFCTMQEHTRVTCASRYCSCTSIRLHTHFCRSLAPPHLHCPSVPLVQVERTYFGDMNSKTAMNSWAFDAQRDAKVDAGPLHVCTMERKQNKTLDRYKNTVFPQTNAVALFSSVHWGGRQLIEGGNCSREAANRRRQLFEAGG